MNRKETLKQIQNIYEDALGFKLHSFKEEELILALGVNSLTNLYIILMLEKTFNIKFNLEELVQVETIGELINMIERLRI